MATFSFVFLLLITGVLLQYSGKFPRSTSAVLNQYVIYVSLPALVLVKIAGLNFSREMILPVIIAWLVIISSALIVFILSKLFRWHKNLTGALMLIVPLGNTSFLGIPMVEAYFGSRGVAYAILYDQFGSFLALATYGSFILAIFEGDKKPSIKDITKRVIFFPPFIALIAAMILKAWTYPQAVTDILERISLTLVPVVMVAVGFQLNLKIESVKSTPLWTGLLIKLLVSPLIALLFCHIFGLNSLAARVSVFESGMGPMITAGAVAISADLSPNLTASMLGLGLLLAFLTLPLLYLLL